MTLSRARDGLRTTIWELDPLFMGSVLPDSMPLVVSIEQLPTALSDRTEHDRGDRGLQAGVGTGERGRNVVQDVRSSG